MGQRQDSEFILGNLYPELGVSAKTFLIETFETAHDYNEVTEDKSNFIISLANMAFGIITPMIAEPEDPDAETTN